MFKSKRFPGERKYSWIAVGVGVVGAVGGAISRGKANRKLSKLQQQAEDNAYQENPLAKQRLGLATTLLNARMPGAAAAERNIYTSGANAYARTSRNAGDSTQALGVGAAIQGQEGQDFSNLAQQEAQDYQRRYANQQAAVEGQINEGDKVQNSKQQLLGQQAQIQGAQSANNAATWSSISNLGFSAANFGMQGGFNSGMGQNFWGGGNGNAGANAYQMQRTSPYNPQLQPY